MSDTPRTDHEQICTLGTTGFNWIVPADFARQLERELIAAKEHATKFDDPAVLHAHCVRALSDGHVAHLFGERMTVIQNDRASLQQQVAELQGALERLRKLR